MGSLATFKTTYLATPPVPTGNREQLAGLIYAIDRQVADGNSVIVARQSLPAVRTGRVLHRAQRSSNPFQGALAADFYALDAA